MFSFSSLFTKTGAPPIKAVNGGDPLDRAKGAILKAIDEQKSYLNLTVANQPLPKTKGGKKLVSTWFTKAADGYWLVVRYGQLTLPIADGAMFVETAEKLRELLEAIKNSVRSGELDDIIGNMQRTRSAALSKGKKKAA